MIELPNFIKIVNCSMEHIWYKNHVNYKYPCIGIERILDTQYVVIRLPDGDSAHVWNEDCIAI